MGVERPGKESGRGVAGFPALPPAESAVSILAKQAGRSPGLQCLRRLPTLLVLVVDPGKEGSCEAHLGEEARLLLAVAERVDLPGSGGPGALAKGVQQPAQPQLHVVNDGGVMGHLP